MSIETIDKELWIDCPDRLKALAEQICQAVAAIRFGSVEIVIHEGRVVQIERRERIRVERMMSAETAS